MVLSRFKEVLGDGYASLITGRRRSMFSARIKEMASSRLTGWITVACSIIICRDKITLGGFIA